MGLLATLGLNPPPSTKAPAFRPAAPMQASLQPAAPPQVAASLADQWAVEPGSDETRHDTPFGPFHISTHTDGSAERWLTEALGIAREAQAEHDRMKRLERELDHVVEKFKKGPQTAAEVRSLVRDHASVDAVQDAETARASDNVVGAMHALLGEINLDIDRARTDLVEATEELAIHEIEAQALELRRRTKEAEETIDTIAKVTTEILSAAETVKERKVPEKIVELFVWGAKKFYDYGELAGDLEKLARSRQQASIEKRLARTREDLRRTRESMGRVKRMAEQMMTDANRNLERADVQFDRGSNLPDFKMTSLSNGVKLAGELMKMGRRCVEAAQAAEAHSRQFAAWFSQNRDDQARPDDGAAFLARLADSQAQWRLAGERAGVRASQCRLAWTELQTAAREALLQTNGRA